MTQEAHRYSYAEAGVDVGIEAQAAAILYDAAKATWGNREGQLGSVEPLFDGFAGGRITRVGHLPEGTVMQSCTDGVGTKAEIARRAGNYSTLGYDLVAMVADDAVIRGGEPVSATDTLVVNTLGTTKERLAYIHQLADGLVAAAEQAGIAIVNGEIAQHSNLAPREEFALDWSASLNWFGHESRMLTGREVQPGDVLIALGEEGFRANGLSLVRAVLQGEYGDHWEDEVLEGQRIVDAVLQPSRIYAKAIVAMTGGWDLNRQPKAVIHAAAHITGGGIPEKLGRALAPSGLGAIIDDPFSPSAIMTHVQRVGNISDAEAYKTWNMGQGMIVIAPKSEDVMKVALEYGIPAKIIGRITHDPGITIYSKGVGGEVLQF